MITAEDALDIARAKLPLPSQVPYNVFKVDVMLGTFEDFISGSIPPDGKYIIIFEHDIIDDIVVGWKHISTSYIEPPL